ncbi:hypothetical protein GQ53DRAFT_438664 [Thozetella sp. PMI_491]|nr:hypothetical protein GQ53DRAFT_438664 [Thozetella sp. PMI_491]
MEYGRTDGSRLAREASKCHGLPGLALAGRCPCLPRSSLGGACGEISSTQTSAAEGLLRNWSSCADPRCPAVLSSLAARSKILEFLRSIPCPPPLPGASDSA